MKGSQAIRGPPGLPEGSLEGLDLSLTGLPPPVSRRPSSASAAKSVLRSVSVVTGSEPKRKAPEATGPGASRATNNLRRSNSTTQVHQPQAQQAPLERPDFLTLCEGSPGGKKKPASLSTASREKGATWNVLQGDQPRALDLPPTTQSPGTWDAPVGSRRRECSVPLAPSFTANNRSSKAAVGNCVTTMVHNHYAPVDMAPPKSSNHSAPSLNNLVKAATREGEGEGRSLAKPQNSARSSHEARSSQGAAQRLLRQREVTEEEAERFIHQVHQAAVTIQRWYRHQARRRRAQAARPEHLLAAKREGQRQWPGEGNLLDLHQQREAARRKAREEKARRARQAAIQELQQKRAQKGGDAKLGLLKGTQERGQPWPAQEPSPRPGDSARQTPKANNTGASCPAACPEDPCPPAPDCSPEHQQLPEDKPQAAAGEATETSSACRATLDELLDTLRLLEEEPEPLPRPRAYHKDNYAWTDEVTEDDASSLTADNLEKFGKLSAPAGPPEFGTLLSEAKLQSVMSFLREMEKSGQDPPASAPQGPVLEEGLGHLESVSQASASLMRLKLEVEEKKQAVALLHRALAQQRDLTVRRVKETEKELGRQLRQQREYYEAAIQRQLSFIDQLIKEKTTLGEKCQAAVAELLQGDQRHKEREAQLQEQQELEIKKLKELMSATEKVRREKWMNEKTRKIKEITVRGLEPEIQKLIAKHKQELRKLRTLHAAELLQAEERAAQRHGRQVEVLREQLEREKEALAQQERERTQQRQRAELEELRQQLEESSSARGRALRAEFEKGREALEHRHQMELQSLKDQLEVERQMWEANCAKKEEAWLLNRERELKEEIRRGRDQDIELVIRRLEADMTLAREESERTAEGRVQRLRDKYEAELSERERCERKLQDQCAELKGRLAEAEAECARLQGLVRQKDKALADVKAVNEQLVGERSGLAQVLRQEFADQLVASAEENRQARAELAELRACRRLELEQLRREKVKMALAKKEEAVSSLRKQHEAAVKRADHLEELLEQRRQPLPSAK
uniref:Centrosomal protein 131 n=1 Tax=Molossus molossus TaxID=27622 RepID=A0A7J8CWV8_MOLMO|nr:centrosomal protein 131 [Molossus molossus]